MVILPVEELYNQFPLLEFWLIARQIVPSEGNLC